MDRDRVRAERDGLLDRADQHLVVRVRVERGRGREVDDQADVPAVPPVAGLDHALVEHDRVRPALRDLGDDAGHVAEALDLPEGHAVVHGHDHGPARVPVHEPLEPDLLADHRSTSIAFGRSPASRGRSGPRPGRTGPGPGAGTRSARSRSRPRRPRSPPRSGRGSRGRRSSSRPRPRPGPGSPASPRGTSRGRPCTRSSRCPRRARPRPGPRGLRGRPRARPRSSARAGTSSRGAACPTAGTGPRPCPRSSSMRASESAPMLTCIETASAPMLRALVTVLTSTFSFGSGPIAVEAERCRIRPTSGPRRRWPYSARPMWPSTAFAPPSATASTVGAEVDQAVDRPLRDPVVHGDDDGPLRVPVDDAFKTDLFSSHDRYSRGPGTVTQRRALRTDNKRRRRPLA